MGIRATRSAMLVWACLALLLAGDSHARQIESWPYEKLFKHADLVVVVKPLSVRDATAKDKAVPPPGTRSYLTGIVTNFKVLVVVKGEHKEKELAIVHFRLKEDKAGLVGNGPLLVSFPTKREKGQLGGFGPVGWPGPGRQQDYMLFLKKGKEGRLEFVSGQFDPALSVK